MPVDHIRRCRQARSRRPRRRGVGVERLEPRSMLAGLAGSVRQTIDVADVAPDNPLAFKPLPGVTVQLDDGSQVVTDASGHWAFADVPAGRRTVSVLPPAGYFGASEQALSYAVQVADADVAGLNFALTERNEAIVQNLFELVLQRPASADEFTAAVLRLDAGLPVSGELRRLLGSQEFRTVVQPVAGFVQAMFPGVLEIGMVRASGQQQRLGIRQDATVQGIMTSQAFLSTHGDVSGLANADYVRFLYREMLSRGPSARQLRTAVSRLEQGTTRGQLALDLARTAAFQDRRQLNRAWQGAITYVGVLGREATVAEVNAYSRSGGGAVQLANRLVRSGEFRDLDGYTSTAIWDVMSMSMSLAPSVAPLDRLQRYNPATRKFDLPVTAGSIPSSFLEPRNLYVYCHGWSPGDSQQVLLGSTPGNPLKSWNATPPVPEWLFEATPEVSVAGLAQSIVDADPTAIVLAYSWIDLSATAALTGDGTLESIVRSLAYVGRSESRTQWAGLMLAEALEQAIAPTFYGDFGKGLVHILGHSHGAKVATVATLEMGDFFPVSHLTLFDSPETGPIKQHPLINQLPLGVPGIGGGENFVWRYLQELEATSGISRIPVDGRSPTTGTFVDNYYSQTGFGAPFGGYTGLGEVVDVQLRPAELYNNPSTGILGDLGALFSSHDYPPAWYPQASLQNPAGPANTQNGLAWSPLVNPLAPLVLASTYDQFPQSGTASRGEFVRRQFELAPGGAAAAVPVTSFPLAYGVQPTIGEVTDTGTTMTLGVAADTPLSIATVAFQPFGMDATDKPMATGLELDVSFAGVDPGETVQLVVSVHGTGALDLDTVFGNVYVSKTTGLVTIPLLTLDGNASGPGPRMATVSLDVFRNQTLVQGGFATPANPVPQLVFSLIGSRGAEATATVSRMRQFGTPTTPAT